MKESEAGDINGLISSESLERDNEKRLLEAELLQRSHQLRNFDRFKYALTTSGEDYAAAYKRISAERAQVAERLRALNDTVITDPGAEMFFVSHHELVAPRLGHVGEGPFVFGTEGCVALPRATDGVSVVPDRSKTFGEIKTTELGPLGSITFRSEDPTGQEIGLGVNSGEVEQVWLRNWRCVVLFPCTTAESYLNYKFTVGVTAQLFSEAAGLIMAFTSIGEEPNASPTSNIVVNTSAGWPLIADLEEPSEFYNGHYGHKLGSLTVNRTFKVSAGRTPAVAIVVGFVVRLMGVGRLRLSFAGDSHIGFSNGQVCYRYTPIPVLAQT